MARRRTQFDEYATGAQPSDWTEQWVTGSKAATVESSGIPAGAISSQALKIVGTSNARYAISWDSVGEPDGSVEILTRAQYVSSNAAWTVLRGGGSASTEDGYLLNIDTVSNDWAIRKFVSGAAPAPFVTISQTFDNDIWYWTRQQYDDDDQMLRGKVWAGDLLDEPTDWQAEASDSELSSGWVGIGRFPVVGDTWVDFFSVGTDGDSAAGPEPETTATTPAPAYTITVRDWQTLEVIGRVTRPISASWTHRLYSASDFRLTFYDDENELIRAADLFVLTADDELDVEEHVVEIRRDGDLEFAGMIDHGTLDDASGLMTIKGL